MPAITIQDIHAARDRIKEYIHVTEMHSSRLLGELSENDVFLKPENFQKVGAFKFRGAMNALLALDPEVRQRGVVTGSSGNHGQAVARAAQILGVPAVIVVPQDASPAKVRAIGAYGATLEYFGTSSVERIARAKMIAQEREMYFVHPFDDPLVMAGQGTAGLEIYRDLPSVEAVLVPCGGGGLISGVATALKACNPDIKIYGVEPESSNSTFLSLRKGKRVSLDTIVTIADGVRTAMPGEYTFPIERECVEEVLLVSEEAIKKAVLFLLERCKMLVEPSGALSV
ncbi:MAG TPA: threonine/serine dehydratase, partial [Synergistaceae bacterium]|nr:threonine/serine dehydratase [Synergistaceae bacterium]